MRRLIFAALLVLSATHLLAAGWNKPYFAATKPGSFATYKTTASVGPSSTYTMTRLADRNGQVILDVYAEYADNVSPANTTRYELAKGFDADRNLIDYLSGLTSMSVSLGKDGKFDPLPAVALTNITAMPTYVATALFKATETIDGKSCDHYSYIRDEKGAPTVETGDIWLNPTVPFGMVKHTTSTKDRSGKVAYGSETVLVTSGSKPVPAATTTAAPAADPATPQTMTLTEAYNAGLIYVSVEIAPTDKRGDRLNLRIETRGKPLNLTLATGTTSLRVEIPFENLVFTNATARKFALTDAAPVALGVTQLGTSRVVAGKFRIYIDEGKTYFSGSASMDHVK